MFAILLSYKSAVFNQMYYLVPEMTAGLSSCRVDTMFKAGGSVHGADQAAAGRLLVRWPTDNGPTQVS